MIAPFMIELGMSSMLCKNEDGSVRISMSCTSYIDILWITVSLN